MRERNINVREKYQSVASPKQKKKKKKKRIHNPGMCPDRELKQRPFSLQDNCQSTEPQWSG